MPENGSIEMSAIVNPTPEQYSAIRRFLNEHDEAEIEFSGVDGRSVDSKSYSNGVNADALDLENNIGNWYCAYTDYLEGRIDQDTYEDWKFKYPAFAGFDEDDIAVIFYENQSLVPNDIPELDLTEEELEAMRREYEEDVEEEK